MIQNKLIHAAVAVVNKIALLVMTEVPYTLSAASTDIRYNTTARTAATASRT